MSAPEHPGRFRQALLDAMPTGEWKTTSRIARDAFDEPPSRNYSRAYRALATMGQQGLVETSDTFTALGTHGAGRVWRKKPSYDVPPSLQPAAIEHWLTT